MEIQCTTLLSAQPSRFVTFQHHLYWQGINHPRSPLRETFQFPHPQALLFRLYRFLDKEEELIQNLGDTVNLDSRHDHTRHLFAVLYRPRGEACPGVPASRIRLVGPVGERPVHVCLLRAEIFDGALQEGLLEGVKYVQEMDVEWGAELGKDGQPDVTENESGIRDKRETTPQARSTAIGRF
jgi:hypothetical protein